MKESYSAIHTFTVVASELNFTRAAELLHITPSAVSHQIKLLESQMGATLFHRQSKGVRLSLAGEALFRHASVGVRNIQHGVLESQFVSQKEKLVIAVIPSFCQLWLMPRLKGFCAAHSHIELELVAVDQLVDLHSGRYDGHIHFGAGEYSGCEARLLGQEMVYPVCHPDFLLAEERSLETLIAKYGVLIYKAGIEDEPGGISWGQWLEHHEIDKPHSLAQMSFSHVAMVLASAKQKLGIGLGWDKLVQDDINRGHLARIGTTHMHTRFSYHLVGSHHSWQSDAFNQFADWLSVNMAE